MKLRVVVLGAGFGGLELTSILSEKMGNQLDLTLIDNTGYLGRIGNTTDESSLYRKDIGKGEVKIIDGADG